MTVAVLGEALIDFIVGDDGAYRPHLGGSPYNVAISLARQGIPVSYLSPFSDDTFGDQLRSSLIRAGVAVPQERRSRWPTSLALVTIDEAGLPTYRLYREGIADKDISFEDIVASLPDDLQVFHTGSLAITPSQLPKIRKLFELMRERNVTVSMDINIRLRASVDTKAYLDGVRSLLPLADIAKASDEDLEPFQFATDTRKAAARAYEEMGSGMLVLTEGKGGALLHTANGVVEAKAYPITHVADTVGAGDTFHSAILAALVRGGAIGGRFRDVDREVLENAVDFACAAAAINVSRKGCSPPTQKEVEDFIESTRRQR
jgi:fructokinase